MKTSDAPSLDSLEFAWYRVPTDLPESDGTLRWNYTGMTVVHVTAGGKSGLGWSYASNAAGTFVGEILRDAVVGQPVMAIEGLWQEMNHRLRNAGRSGAGMMAISAVDVALWDLKAKLLGRSLVELFGDVRHAAQIYGSGGFTSYTNEQLADQLGGWADSGMGRVKMKVGRDANADLTRVRIAREAIGPDVELFVDANGGYTCKQALAMGQIFADRFAVKWFEEPRPSDDLAGLRLLRDRGPAGVDIAAGEYGDTPGYFRRMLEAGAVDCLQADATRCGGYTGFLKVAALCEAFDMPLSAHCAPQLHMHVACAIKLLRHIEYFHDHVRIENMLFDGVMPQVNGMLQPDRGRVGHGLTFKAKDAQPFLA